MKPFLVAVVGPTAAGKTHAAIKLAQSYEQPVEIVSMDAMQVYQGMCIGTARLLPDDWCGIPHHMLSVIPPDEPFSVSDYAAMVLPLLESLYKRGVQPILCGGTGLYLDALQRPLQFANLEANPTMRAELELHTSTDLHTQLMELDPPTAVRLPIGDRRRIIRALEVILLTGKPLSAYQDDGEDRFDLCLLGITLPREVLYQRIQTRVETMFQQGLVDEVSFLLKYGLSPDSQAMQALGYKETIRYLRHECSLPEAMAAIVKGTRHYAKRQMTWFRKYSQIQWMEEHERAAIGRR